MFGHEYDITMDNLLEHQVIYGLYSTEKNYINNFMVTDEFSDIPLWEL